MASKLAHMVYFTLHDSSEAACDKLIADCEKYLTDHAGTIYFSVGKRVPDLQRPVNDQEFHVALNVVFDSREAHDRYQTDPRHLKFIEENKSTWKQARIFDSYVN